MLPESDIGVFEAPPTYDDALKHPTVPPDRRSANLDSVQAVASPAGVANPTFMDDAGQLPPTASNEPAVEELAAAGPLPPRLRLGSVSSSDTCGSSSLPHSPVGSRSSVSSMGTVEPDAELSNNEPSTSTEARGRLNGILKWARHRIRRGSSPAAEEQMSSPPAPGPAAQDVPSTSSARRITVAPMREETTSAVAAASDVNLGWTRREPSPLTPAAQNEENESLEMQGTLV